MIPDQAVKVEASEWQVDSDNPRSASDVNLVESGKNGGRTVSGVELGMKVLGEEAMEIRRGDERRVTVTMKRNVSFKFNFFFFSFTVVPFMDFQIP